MKIPIKRFLVFFCISVLFVCSSAFEAVSLELRMSYNGPADPENNAVHLFASNFKSTVEERTEGNVKIRLFPDSQLGNEEERMELLMKSGMNQPIINIASYAGIAPVFPEMYASNIPFLFNGYEAAHIFFDSSRFIERAKKEFHERTGAYLVEVIEEGGFLAFTNSKKEIRSPEDFEGLKFRGMAEDQVALYKSFGASGTPIPWTELYMALKTGVVDGQMNPAMYIKMGSLYEVQKYLTLANIQYSDQFLVINGDIMGSMPEEYVKAILGAAAEANEENRKVMEEQDSKDIQFLVDKGMVAYTPDESEMEQFREKGQPAYIEWLRDQIEKEWVDLALECAERANEKAGQ
jgi:tripartite ATP-independent transporter DctP family solute receptor